ncbi:tubulin epsilon and delta complex protein 1 isoform X1 [Parambassis ranga]|uniref:Tubulin epsilon and delta complex protein 1 isoform X1 n=1 Tax=Parambassis ranga TaxID=210632 RepID=A0A6P7H8V6_9TELE|nr:tubulin epsilon and delta complex protein 1 isoform X1 [Parambassis ranga]
MQRSKAPVSVEVKQVIGALCRLLTATGLDPVPTPETFRRAKFGCGNEEDQFWQLLASILQNSGIVSDEVCTQLRGECRKLVTAGLWQTGYYADWMYETEERGQEGTGFSSRDLLLALGWLLAAGTLENLMTQRVQQLDRTLLISIPVSRVFSGQLPLDSGSLRRLQWLTGCLRHQGRTLLSMLQERTKVLHAVLSVSLSSTGPSCSYQSSTVLKEECVCMRQLCDVLEAYLKWKQVEKVFWTWMDSVVDGHLTDPVVKSSPHAPTWSPRVCHHGNQGLEKLQNVLSRLPTAQVGLLCMKESAHKRGKMTLFLVIMIFLCSLQDGLEPLSSLSSLHTLTQAYRPRLKAESDSCPVRRSAEGSSSGTEVSGVIPVSEAAEMLLHEEALLLERRDKQRLANRMQLQEMIGRLDELVLIPP